MSKTDETPDEREARLKREIQEEENLALETRLSELKKSRSDSTEKSTAPLKPLSVKKVSKITALVLLPFVAAVFAHFVVIPQFAESKAQDQLDSLLSLRGSIVAANSELVTFTGQSIATANAEQKALATSETPTTPPGFIFTNGKEGEKKTVEVYVDFAQQSSRDFLLLNQGTLQAMVEGGSIELVVRPIPGGQTFSMYGPEAVAEAVYYAPDEAWAYMMEVLKLSAETQDEALANGPLAKKLGETADAAGIQGIDGESIQNGTFASWLLSIGEDERVKAGVTLPALYVDGTSAPTEDLDLNNSDVLRNFISSN